jgi:protein O-GlcNAc transferase
MAAKFADLVDRLGFPDAEADAVRAAYAEAGSILEYGSGSSTVHAARLEGKVIHAVESDPRWAASLRDYLQQIKPRSMPVVHWADIGPVGKWGRPYGTAHWERFKSYPLSVWDLPAFVAPDVVLVDGRFRVACFLTAAFRTVKPIQILFDDYTGRPEYHVVEKLYPAERIGRMARFRIEPDPQDWPRMEMLIHAFTTASYAGLPRRTGPARALDFLFGRRDPSAKRVRA